MNPSWKKNYVRYRSVFLNLVGQYKEKQDIKVYLELFLSLGTVVIFAVFALRPTLITISSLIKEIEAKQQTIEEMDNKIEDLITAQRIYDQNRQNLALLMQAVPEKADPDVILRQLEGSITDSQVGVVSLEINDMLVTSNPRSSQNQTVESQSSSTEEITLTITTSADYLNLHNFVNIIEELRKPVKINSTTFNYSVNEETNKLILTVEAVLPVVRRK